MKKIWILAAAQISLLGCNFDVGREDSPSDKSSSTIEQTNTEREPEKLNIINTDDTAPVPEEVNDPITSNPETTAITNIDSTNTDETNTKEESPQIGNTLPKQIDLSGSIANSILHDQFAGQFKIKLCVVNACREQMVNSGGGYSFSLITADWKTSEPITIEVVESRNSAITWQQSLPSIERLLKYDSDQNALIDNREYPDLFLSPANMAYQVMAKQLNQGFQQTPLNNIQKKALREQPVWNQDYLQQLYAVLVETLPKPEEYQHNNNTRSRNDDFILVTVPVIENSLFDLAVKLVDYHAKNNSTDFIEAYQHLAQQANITLNEHQIQQLTLAVEKTFSMDTSTGAYHQLEQYYPHYRLVLNGAFPSQFEPAQIQLQLGLKHNYPAIGYNYKPELPQRPQTVILIDKQNQHHQQLAIGSGTEFSIEIELADRAGTYQTCQPGIIGPVWENRATLDNMQDTLTVLVENPTTGTVISSVLGSFCELSQLSSSADGVLDASEFTPLNVGYLSTANHVLLLKTTLASYGSFTTWRPWSLAELEQKFTNFPREHRELLASIVALQAKGELYGAKIDLIETADFPSQLLHFININLAAEYGIVSNNAEIPSTHQISTLLAQNAGLGDLFIQRNDLNISHVISQAILLLLNSETDKPLFDSQYTPGSWVSVYPNSHLDLACQIEVQPNQLIGISILGQGKDQDGHWVTVGWNKHTDNSVYSIAWSTTQFSQFSDALQQVDNISEPRITIRGLTQWQDYVIRVDANDATMSAPLNYRAGQTFIPDTRITTGIANDDANRGRDANSLCDPLSGKATNSHRDGELGAKFLKLNQQGLALKRQDLSLQQQAFSCVVDSQTGLVWETKTPLNKTEDASIHSDSSYFAFQEVESDILFKGSCYNPDTQSFSADSNICHAQQQIAWVNQEKLCGLENWRLPTQQELYGLINLQGDQAYSINQHYFPLSSGIKTTQPDQDPATKDEYIYHGFWTSDIAPVEADHARVIRPDTQNRSQSAPYRQPHSVMLVSDGFKIQ